MDKSLSRLEVDISFGSSIRFNEYSIGIRTGTIKINSIKRLVDEECPWSPTSGRISLRIPLYIADGSNEIIERDSEEEFKDVVSDSILMMVEKESEMDNALLHFITQDIKIYRQYC